MFDAGLKLPLLLLGVFELNQPPPDELDFEDEPREDEPRPENPPRPPLASQLNASRTNSKNATNVLIFLKISMNREALMIDTDKHDRKFPKTCVRFNYQTTTEHELKAIK